jgi:uncharacterized protein YhaN
MYFSYFLYSFGLGILILLTYGILEWLHIPAGNLVDWLIGVASFWWLIFVVTIPWNIYFEAREVLAEADASVEKGILVKDKQVKYVKLITRWSLIGAVALHLLSAFGLYTLAAFGISAVGYASSAATLLLTGLRPAIRAYQYLAMRLRMIRQEIKYPREDIVELRSRVSAIEADLKGLKAQVITKAEAKTVIQLQQNSQEMRQKWAQLRANLDQLQANNEVEHQRLATDAENAISQLSEDSRFLGQVREIIRFIKAA